ncbi:MAG: hypothetical protein Q4F21_09420 [Lachnospiraceae bacterium]|nr:hypothetical protein [Lachnospiraceae bacterium]
MEVGKKNRKYTNTVLFLIVVMLLAFAVPAYEADTLPGDGAYTSDKASELSFEHCGYTLLLQDFICYGNQGRFPEAVNGRRHLRSTAFSFPAVLECSVDEWNLKCLQEDIMMTAGFPDGGSANRQRLIRYIHRLDGKSRKISA